jgi:hypothetical protein
LTRAFGYLKLKTGVRDKFSMATEIDEQGLLDIPGDGQRQ